MRAVSGAVMVVGFAASAAAFTRLLAPRGAVEAVLLAFLVWSGEVLLSGYVLSGASAFGSPPAWAGCGAVRLALAVRSGLVPPGTLWQRAAWLLSARG